MLIAAFQLPAPTMRYCTSYVDAPVTAPQLTVAVVDEMPDDANPEGTLHVGVNVVNVADELYAL